MNSLFIAAVFCLSIQAQVQAPLDATGIGLAAGAPAAAFSLPDQSGHLRNLESLMGPQGLVLVFFRSADW